MTKLEAILLAVLMATVPSLAHADGAGSALGVKQQAAAELKGETRTLRVGSDIFIGDLVQTGPAGQVQILFSDNTELVLGPSAALTIEDYLIRNDGSAGKLAVDILGGAFRFATGDSAKNRYIINTPTGTIGVRGTEFDGWVGRDGIGYVIRHGGTVILCDDDKQCDVLDDICEVGKIGDGEISILGDARKSTGETRAIYKRWFIWTQNQASLLRQFWFPNARDCLNARTTDVVTDDSNTNNGGGNVVDDGGSGKPAPADPEPPVVTPPPCTGRACPTL